LATPVGIAEGQKFLQVCGKFEIRQEWYVFLAGELDSPCFCPFEVLNDIFRCTDVTYGSVLGVLDENGGYGGETRLGAPQEPQ